MVRGLLNPVRSGCQPALSRLVNLYELLVSVVSEATSFSLQKCGHEVPVGISLGVDDDQNLVSIRCYIA